MVLVSFCSQGCWRHLVQSKRLLFLHKETKLVCPICRIKPFMSLLCLFYFKQMISLDCTSFGDPACMVLLINCKFLLPVTFSAHSKTSQGFLWGTLHIFKGPMKYCPKRNMHHSWRTSTAQSQSTAFISAIRPTQSPARLLPIRMPLYLLTFPFLHTMSIPPSNKLNNLFNCMLCVYNSLFCVFCFDKMLSTTLPCMSVTDTGMLYPS